MYFSYKYFKNETFLTIIGLCLIYFIAQFFIGKIILQDYHVLIAFIIAPFFCLVIYLNPSLAIIILPFVTYLTPNGMNFGIPFISPGIFILLLAIIFQIIHIVLNKTFFKPSIIFICVLIMVFNAFLVRDYFDVLVLLQGIAPFFLFSLIVNNEKHARFILKIWLTSYCVFLFKQVVSGFFNSSSSNILIMLAQSRISETGGFNPNEIAWTGVIYVPLSIAMFINSKTKIHTYFWLINAILLLTGIILTFSRAGLFGILLSFIIFYYFFPKYKHYSKLKILLALSVTSIFMIYVINVFSSARVIGNRGISLETFGVIAERFQWIIDAFNADKFHIADTPDLSAHSSFSGAFFLYGPLYFLLMYFLKIYFLYASWFVSKYHKNQEVILISRSLFATGIVAIILSIFGMTMFNAMYLQVYLIMLGYLYVAKSSTKIPQRL